MLFKIHKYTASVFMIHHTSNNTSCILPLKKLFVNALCFAQTLSYSSDIRQPSRLCFDKAKFKQIYTKQDHVYSIIQYIHVIYAIILKLNETYLKLKFDCNSMSYWTRKLRSHVRHAHADRAISL